jgi:predicted dinucleotide-binding enzyme
MRIGVLGTGIVGQTIGGKLVALGHEVKMGSRSATHEKALAWVAEAGARASLGTFADAAAFGELVFNCTSGRGSQDALAAAAAQLDGKVLIDTTNPLDFSNGFPPTLFTGGTDSLGEQAQRLLPSCRVVKALSHITASVMVDPGSVNCGDHDALICGNDAQAKAQVSGLLQEWLGWRRVRDLGDISSARGIECYVALWIRLMGQVGSPTFNIKVVS